VASIRQQMQPNAEAPAPVNKPQPAKEKYNISLGTHSDHEIVNNKINKLFPGKSAADIAEITGAPEGSNISFHDFGDDGLHVAAAHPDLSAHFNIHPASNGDLHTHIDTYHSRGEQGLLHKRFKSTVDAATNLGIKKLSTIGSSDGIITQKDNGGYSWPRVGFNGRILQQQFDTLSPELQKNIDATGPRDFHTLFKAGGANEWKDKHTTTGHLEFDLSPNSPHRNAFDAYHNTKELSRLSGPPASQGSTPTPTNVSTGSNQAATFNNGPGTASNTSAPGATPSVSHAAQTDEATSQRASRRARISNIGKFSRSKLQKLKYALNTPTPTPTPPVNSLLQGTHMEKVLQHLQQHAFSSQTQKIAAKTLQQPPEGTNEYEHLADHIGKLHTSLKFENHPYAKKFNWEKAAAGIHLDHAISHATDLVAQQYSNLHPDAAKKRAVEEMFAHHMGDSEGASPLAREAIDIVKEVAEPDHEDLKKSFERNYFKHHTNLKDPTGKTYNKAILNPDNIPSLDTNMAFKFSKAVAGINFRSALERLNSTFGKTLRELAIKIHNKLKLTPSKVRKAIHETKAGSLANTVQSIFHDDPDKVTSAAAHYGLLTETPSVVIFRTGEGPDSIHHMQVNGSGDKLRARLSAAGLHQRNLIPTKNGYNVIIYDPESKNKEHVHKFANSLGTKVTTKTGISEIIGDGDSPLKADKKARRNYRAIINEESEQGAQ